MIKKFFTLSLVATMLAGFSTVAVQQPSEARGQCGQQSFGNGQFGNRFNTSSNRFNTFGNGLSNAYYGNNGNGLGNGRNPQRQAMKQQRKLQQQLRRQQMAAAGIPFGNNAYNNGLLNANNPLLVGNNGACNQSTAQAYQQGYQAGVNTAYNNNNVNGLYNNGYGVNGLNGLNGLGGINGLNGLNGVTGYLNNGSGVSSILGRVLNGF